MEEEVEEQKNPKEEEEEHYLVNDVLAKLSKEKVARKKQTFAEEFLAV